jgi:hypothetical protein
MISLTFTKKLATTIAGTVCLALSGAAMAEASTFTRTSPVGGVVPTGVTPVGGIVLDLIGTNDVRVTSQLAASQLFVGFFSGNPGTIGSQSGFGASVTSALGGGLKRAAIRITLADGDTAAGNFDFNDNSLLVNGLNFGNFSNVNAENTNGVGDSTALGFSGGGFRNNQLDTGWFSVLDAALLGSFYSSLLSTQQVVYQLNDADPGENFFDFTQGVDGSLINVGTGPVVQPPTAIPTPALLPGLIGLGWSALRKRKSDSAKDTTEA